MMQVQWRRVVRKLSAEMQRESNKLLDIQTRKAIFPILTGTESQKNNTQKHSSGIMYE